MENGYLSPESILTIQSEIEYSGGNEVFFVGDVGDDLKINGIKTVARGNEFSVPAILDSASSGQVVIHNHPSGILTPSEQDIYLASIFGNNGVGFIIINNSASDLYVVVEPFKKKEYVPLNTGELGKILEPGGGVSENLGESYEYREEQIKVMGEVARAFNEDSIALIEAGTGTGKTFSYLIPSIKWALQNNERVVISTNTINLQEQLIGKDIPLLEESLPENFSYALVKGMRNYICLLRAESADDGQQDLIEDEEGEELKSILEWAKVTADGSLSDMNFSPKPDLWDKVSAESESCIRSKCPHYTDCFFFKKRREISAAQLLIVNHHLFFSDLAIKAATNDGESGILPSYKRVIFDEAHNIVDSATSHFGMTVSRFGLIRILRRLSSRGKRGELKGLANFAATTANKISKKGKNSQLADALYKIEEVVSTRIEGIETSINESFESINTIAVSRNRNGKDAESDLSFRVLDQTRESEVWKKAGESFESLRIKLLDIQNEIKILLEILGLNDEQADVVRLMVEFRSVYSKFEYYLEVINSFFKQQDDLNVKWIELRKRRNNVFISLGISPIVISEHLRKKLYGSAKTVVMTSATMAVEDNFDFQKSQLGLENNPRTRELQIFSPFNYKEQVVLGMPVDIPEPGSPGYLDDISVILKKIILISGGKALILFTSYNTLNGVSGSITDDMAKEGIEVLKQGTLPRDKLLNKFRSSLDTVLLATDSFWEGVDIVGEALKVVVIMRLPFKVPTDPIIEARSEYLEKQGVNSFLGYSVPMAVIKFKQGFGRLIRSKSDRGAVLVLDKRVCTKSYGRYFINSLPVCRKLYGNFHDMVKDLESFT